MKEKEEQTRTNRSERNDQRHPVREERKNSTKYQTPCKYEKEGRCAYGSKCCFLHEHGSEDRNKEGRSKENQNTKWLKPANYCKHEETKEGCLFGPERCWYKHKSKDEEPKKKVRKYDDNWERKEKDTNRDVNAIYHYCKYEETEEGCYFGPKKCWYKHKTEEGELKTKDPKR